VDAFEFVRFINLIIQFFVHCLVQPVSCSLFAVSSSALQITRPPARAQNSKRWSHSHNQTCNMATKPTVTVDLDNYRGPGSHVHDLFSLKNKTVVITGGARGLGLSFARACAEVGANIAALDLLPTPHADFALLS